MSAAGDAGPGVESFTLRDALVAAGVDTQVAIHITSTLSGTQHKQPEWLWYDKSNGGGYGLISWGRWAKAGGQVPYLRGDIVVQALAAASAERDAAVARARSEALEEAARVAEADSGHAAGGNTDFGPNVSRRIAVRIRALKPGSRS